MKQNKKSLAGKIPTDTKAQMVYAILLFVVAVFLSRSDPVADWESWLFFSVYDLPSFLHGPFLFITQLGSVYVLGVLSLIFLFTNHYHKLLRLLLTGLLAYIISGFAKDMWGRGRPFELLEGVDNLEYIIRGPGFPSGHMALATAMALVLGHYIPKKYRLLIVFWIVGVGLSRVFLGVHMPTDIVGGFAIGWFSYALFMQVRLRDVSKKRQKSTVGKSKNSK